MTICTTCGHKWDIDTTPKCQHEYEHWCDVTDDMCPHCELPQCPDCGVVDCTLRLNCDVEGCISFRLCNDCSKFSCHPDECIICKAEVCEKHCVDGGIYRVCLECLKYMYEQALQSKKL